MKKYIKLFFLSIILFVIFISNTSYASSTNLENFDINNINLNSIDESKKDELKKALENINFNEINISNINDSVDTSNNVDINSIKSTSVDVNKISEIYEELSQIVSDEEMADLIKDNSELITNAGISKQVVDTSEQVLRNFDTKTVIDVMQNDLDVNHLLELYEKGASAKDILESIINDTSTSTKINVIFKLLLSNTYLKIGLFILILVCIYSIYITGLIFKKAGKTNYITLIPIYRDVVHLKICNLSPWLLLLVLLPFIGWLMLISVAIIARFELSKSFGHGFFFGLGLLFFPIIFRSIIAFSKNKFVENLYED